MRQNGMRVSLIVRLLLLIGILFVGLLFVAAAITFTPVSPDEDDSRVQQPLPGMMARLGHAGAARLAERPAAVYL